VWIATTVIVILFLTGTINQYLGNSGLGKDGKGGTAFAYDFKLLSGAAGLVYGYTGIVPVGLWAVLKWYGSESANLLECACLYGYANLVWIAVALVAWSPWGSEFFPSSLRFSLATERDDGCANWYVIYSSQLHGRSPRSRVLRLFPPPQPLPCAQHHGS
jgi:hypothetical protein